MGMNGRHQPGSNALQDQCRGPGEQSRRALAAQSEKRESGGKKWTFINITTIKTCNRSRNAFQFTKKKKEC